MQLRRLKAGRIGLVVVALGAAASFATDGWAHAAERPSRAAAAATVGAPSSPGFPRATAGIAAAQVSWFPPAANGSPITGSVITPYVNGVAQPARTFTTSANVETVVGLTNDVTYTFRIAAINAYGTGPQSGPTGPVTPEPQPPGRPAFTSASSANHGATVSWFAPADNGAPIGGYVITPYVDGSAQPQQSFPSNATVETVVGLTNGVTYTFRIAAYNLAGRGPQSGPTNAVAAGLPAEPGFQQATAGNASAQVTWARSDGPPITGYLITPYVNGAAQAPQRFIAQPATNSETVVGLTNGVRYTFRVAAYNAIGTGLQSAPTDPVTVGVPGSPGFQRATAGNASAKVTWFPAPANGSPITGYLITPYRNGIAQPTRTFATNANVETVVGLTSGASYTFRIAAVNAVGTGPRSDPTGPVTPS